MCPVPYTVKHKDKWYHVPCGKCIMCKKRRANDWAFRIENDMKNESGNYFITLTYDADNLVIKDDYPVLCKQDLQKFFKRLRKIHSNVRYYAVGEYGGKTSRPHYHVIFIGSGVKQTIFLDYVKKSWQLGLVHIGSAEPKSVRYCLKYISKSKTSYEVMLNLKYDNVYKSFSLMSKGIGLKYVSNKQIYDNHKKDVDRMYYVLDGGIKLPLPRYIKQKIYNDDELLRSKIRRELEVQPPVDWKKDKHQRLHMYEILKLEQVKKDKQNESF